uniref:MFS domain-containing protein n=1 Tax=Rhabditophanes sp. KR3021 TaxID=114890 RepID=A0AC35TNK7_9BILA
MLKIAALLGSKRLTLAILLFFACAISYSHRTDLSLGVVCMVNHSAVEQINFARLATLNVSSLDTRKSTSCGNTEDGSVEKAVDGPFVWDKAQQGQALASFFYGYLCSQIIGGMIAQKYGAKVVIGISLTISSVLTVMTPSAAEMSLLSLVAVRAVLGFAQGVIMPCIHTIWSFWAPENERSILVGFSFAGLQIGNLVSISLSSVLCSSGPFGGWPSIFYLFGFLGFVWCTLWYFLAASKPADAKGISEKEKAYLLEHIRKSMGKNSKPPVIPWKDALLSLPVWACFAGHFAADFGSYLMMGVMPTLMNDLFALPRATLGLISALPFLAFFLVIQFGGILADHVITKKYLSLVNTRRLFMAIALVLQGLFIVIAGYMECSQTVIAISLIVVAVGLSGFQFSSFVVSYLDIAPAFAGTLVGIGNTLSSSAGFLGPWLMAYITPNSTREEWQIFFWVNFGILVAGAVLYGIFIKGEVQHWAKTDGGLPTQISEDGLLLDDLKKPKPSEA